MAVFLLGHAAWMRPGGAYCTQIEPATNRLHDQFIKKHGRKPTLEEFMDFEEPYCTQIEPRALWSCEGCGQIVHTLLKKYPCLSIITDMADEYFVGFRQYIQDEMNVILELKMLIEADLKCPKITDV
ncbi:hypothetical protein ACFLZY_00915 [Patescibacteria group bacterium]